MEIDALFWIALVAIYLLYQLFTARRRQPTKAPPRPERRAPAEHAGEGDAELDDALREIRRALGFPDEERPPARPEPRRPEPAAADSRGAGRATVDPRRPDMGRREAQERPRTREPERVRQPARPTPPQPPRDVRTPRAPDWETHLPTRPGRTTRLPEPIRGERLRRDQDVLRREDVTKVRRLPRTERLRELPDPAVEEERRKQQLAVLMRRFASSNEMRQAYLMKEILGRPRAFRPYRLHDR